MTPAPITRELAALGRRSLALRTMAAFGELPEPAPRSLPLRIHQPPTLDLSSVCQDGTHHNCPRWLGLALRTMRGGTCRCLCHRSLVGDYRDYMEWLQAHPAAVRR